MYFILETDNIIFPDLILYRFSILGLMRSDFGPMRFDFGLMTVVSGLMTSDFGLMIFILVQYYMTFI
jgi:hypothetical protein